MERQTRSYLIAMHNSCWQQATEMQTSGRCLADAIWIPLPVTVMAGDSASFTIWRMRKNPSIQSSRISPISINRGIRQDEQGCSSGCAFLNHAAFIIAIFASFTYTECYACSAVIVRISPFCTTPTRLKFRTRNFAKIQARNSFRRICGSLYVSWQ